MIAERGVRVWTCERAVESFGMKDFAVAVGVRGGDRGARALIPDGEQTRRAVVVQKIWMREVNAPVNDTDDDASPFGALTGRASLVRLAHGLAEVCEAGRVEI